MYTGIECIWLESGIGEPASACRECSDVKAKAYKHPSLELIFTNY